MPKSSSMLICCWPHTSVGQVKKSGSIPQKSAVQQQVEGNSCTVQTLRTGQILQILLKTGWLVNQSHYHLQIYAWIVSFELSKDLVLFLSGLKD
jgi:hypothetical protein